MEPNLGDFWHDDPRSDKERDDFEPPPWLAAGLLIMAVGSIALFGVVLYYSFS